MSVEAITRKGGRAWRVRYRDHGGAPRTETYDLKADADKRDAEIRQAKQRREPIPARGRGNAGQTFETFARDEWWPKDVEGRRLAPKTREMYANLLDVHLMPRIGSDALAFIDVARVIDLRAQLAKDGVGDYTSARALKLLRQILGFAVVTGRIPYNPADVLRARGALPPQGRKTDVRPLAPEETEALRRKLLARPTPHALRDATLVSVIAYAGLRPEEALALAWEHIGPDHIRVERANRNGELERTKTGTRRTVRPLIRPLVSDLSAWRKASGDTSPGALVFPNDDGQPWDAWQYANWRRRTFKPNAPAGARPYDLRHGYASLLVREGADLADVARRMGHSPTMTTQHYTHIFEAYRDRKAEPMAKVVKAARAAKLAAAA